MSKAIWNVRSVAFLLALSGTLVPATAQQGLTVDDIVERLRDRAGAAGTTIRRDDLDELRRNRAAGITFENRKRAIERAMLEPTIDLQIPFDYNKAELSAQAYPILQRLMEALPRASPLSDFLIIGHTDSTGPEDYNQTLSENRARTIYEYIIDRSSIDRDRLSWIGLGSNSPLPRLASTAPANRRVQIINIGPPPPLRPISRTVPPPVWGLIGMVLVAGFAARYWMSVRSFYDNLAQGRERVIKLDKTLESLGLCVHELSDKMQRKFASVETGVATLSVAVGTARREAHDVEKHAGKLDTKSAVATAKAYAIRRQVDMEVGELKRISDQVNSTLSNLDRNTRQIDHLEHEVHNLGMLKQIADQVSSRMSGVGQEMRRIAAQVKQSTNGSGRNGLYLGHVEDGARGVEHHEARRKAIAELKAADRKIEHLMDDTIQTEAVYRTNFGSQLDDLELAQEYEEHHRKLIEAAQQIYGAVHKYLVPTAVEAMEAENEQVDWNRGELFANTASLDAARAYHQQVKDYFIKLKDAITKSLHERA